MQSVPVTTSRLRVLVVAHDFPPNPSPQSMRIGRLVDGLLADGCEVHVLAGSHRPHWGAAAAEYKTRPGLTITRGLPSGVDRFIDLLRAWRRRLLPDRGVLSPQDANALPRLNWKGRIVVRMKELFSGLLFPGETRAWLSSVRPVLMQQLKTLRPDCIVLSHEPPAGLMLSRLCRQAGIPMIAELGDPVCAPYTPVRWRWKALRLESRVCRDVDHIVVTCEATRALLCKRHGIDPARISVLTQGFPETAPLADPFPAEQPLRLVYTGRFYPFRDPTPLLDAVAAVPDVELLIACGPMSERTRRTLPPNVRVLGDLPHAQALQMQATAHVLVNIANDGLPQIPGKFFEYLALARPILHLACSGADEQADLLRQLQRGWVVPKGAERIAALLRDLAKKHHVNRLADGLDLSDTSVQAYAWTRIASRFAGIVRAAAAGCRVGTTGGKPISVEYK